jgi:hypothetical protein
MCRVKPEEVGLVRIRAPARGSATDGFPECNVLLKNKYHEKNTKGWAFGKM